MAQSEGKERRASDRTAIAIFVTVRGPERELVARATDLSAGGIRVEYAGGEGGPVFEVGQSVEVSFELPETDRTIATRGEVVHAAENRVGVAFAKLQKSARKAIEAFVEENGPLS